MGGRAETRVIARQRAAMREELGAVIVPSKFMKDFYVAQGAPADRIHLIPYGVLPTAARPRDRVGGARLQAVFVGRLHPSKGLHVLLDAVERLWPERLVQLDVWGPDGDQGEYAHRMRERAERIDGVRWRGELHPGELRQMFDSSDVAVVPSVWDENAPIVIQEALSHRCPVVCTDGRGATEMVEHGINGLIVPMGEVEPLAAALRTLAVNRDVLARFRRQMRPVPSIDEVADRILALYRVVRSSPGATYTVGAPARVGQRS
jgi:glycosyltransferase involved in cell wall biosynthesis